MALLSLLDIHEWQARRALRKVEAGDHVVAEEHLRRLLARRPRQVSALAALGVLLMRQRRFEEAIEIWQRAAAAAPTEQAVAFALARALHRSGALEAAAREYFQVLRLAPLHEKAFLALEQIRDRMTREGLDFKALAEENSAPSDDPGDRIESSLGLASFLAPEGDAAAALEKWREIATRTPESVVPLLHMARLQQQLGETVAAHALYRTVLARAPDNDDALAGYGRAAIELDRTEAIRHHRDWLTRRPDALPPRLKLASLHLQEGEHEAAEKLHDEIIDRLPDHATALARLLRVTARASGHTALHAAQAIDLWARFGRRHGETETTLAARAQLLQGQGRWQEAATCFEALHRLSPRRTDALIGLGRCLEELGRHQEALAAYDQGLALDARQAASLVRRGRLLRHLERHDEAIAGWRRVCAETPGNAAAWHELVFLLASAERDAEAIETLRQAETALPATAASWVGLGAAADNSQLPNQAEMYFQKALASHPDSAMLQGRLGHHYLYTGKIGPASAALSRSLALGSHDPWIAQKHAQTARTLSLLGTDESTDRLIPDHLFEVVRRHAECSIEPYAPVPRRVINVASSLALGGAERQLATLLAGLATVQPKIEASLFCISLARRTGRDFFLPLVAETGTEVVTPPAQAHPDLPADTLNLIQSFPDEMAALIAFWCSEFRRRRPQVVHAWQDNTSLIAGVAALLAGVPRIILAGRSVRPDNPRRRLKRYMQEGYQALLQHPSVVLSNNSQAGATDYAAWLRLPADRVEVVYNGIDFDRLASAATDQAAAAFRQELDVPADAPLVGGVLRLSEEKRPLLWVETAVQVARRIPEAHFVVCGDGQMREPMLALARQHELAGRLHLAGARSDVASCYKAMDVLLLTSRHEGLPNVLMEAQSLGVPVITPDVGGAAETLRQGVTGWAVKDADAASLAAQVARCLQDPAWMATARAEAPRFVRSRFSVQAMLKRTLQLYGIAQDPANHEH